MEVRHGDYAARAAVDAGLKVHQALGPGLLESAYEHCLAYELEKRGLKVERQVTLPIIYDGVSLDANYRLDLVVDRVLVVEIKSVDTVLPLHRAQLLTYLKLSGIEIGLLMNFNVAMFKQGVQRFAI